MPGAHGGLCSEVTLPDGLGVALGVEDAGEALSDLLGRDVKLQVSAGAARGYGATGGHHDFAPVHALTTRSLARMQQRFPDSDWSTGRFRPNLLAELDPATIISDDELLGSSLCAPKSLSLEVGLPTPRCVVVTRAHGASPADASVLRHVAESNRWDLGPFGRPACFGTYAEVVGQGRLHVGDELRFSPRASTARSAVAQAVRRLEAEL